MQFAESELANLHTPYHDEVILPLGAGITPRDFVLKFNMRLEYLNWPKKAFDPPLENNIQSFKVGIVITNFRVVFKLVDYSIVKSRAPHHLIRFFSIDFGSVLRVVQADQGGKSTFNDGDVMANMMGGSSQEIERKTNYMFGLFEQSAS